MHTILHAQTFGYRLFGWTLAADRPIPLPTGLGDVAAPDVEVRFASLATVVGQGEGEGTRAVTLSDGSALVTTGDGLRARIEGGRRVVLDAPGDQLDSAGYRHLLETAALAICHQRGMPPLDAGVVLVGGTAVIVARNGNEHGAGATALRALAARGHAVLSERTAVVDADTGVVLPGLVNPLAGTAPLALVVDVRWRGDLGSPRLYDLTCREATALLRQWTLLRNLAEEHDGQKSLVRWSSALAQMAPVLIMECADGPDQVEAVCAWIEELVETVARVDLD